MLKFKVAVFLLAVLMSVSAFADPSGKGAKSVGAPSPDFETEDLSGAKIASSAILSGGRAVVLNFWGLRCSACIMEMPHINALKDKYGERASFMAINVDAIGGAVLSAQISKMKLDIRSTIVPDPDFRLVDLFGMTAAPLTIVIDSGGTIRYRHEGYEPGDEAGIEEALKGALGGNKKSPR